MRIVAERGGQVFHRHDLRLVQVLERQADRQCRAQFADELRVDLARVGVLDARRQSEDRLAARRVVDERGRAQHAGVSLRANDLVDFAGVTARRQIGTLQQIHNQPHVRRKFRAALWTLQIRVL